MALELNHAQCEDIRRLVEEALEDLPGAYDPSTATYGSDERLLRLLVEPIIEIAMGVR